jgi:palmitoyltransferase
VQFFLNFCQATFVYSSFVFATLIVYTVRMMNASSSDLDPQIIVIIALYVWKITHSLVLDELSSIYRAGLFALFTSTLVVTHVHMILKGQTTVESMSIRSMRERESATLQRAYSWWEFGYVLCSVDFLLPFPIFLPIITFLFPSIVCHCRPWPSFIFMFRLNLT